MIWTTTPWTLPSNLALVVNPDFDYVRVKDHATDKIYVLAACRLEMLYKNWEKAEKKPFTELGRLKGKELENTRYVPLRWGLVGLVLRLIPSCLFRHLNF